MTPSEMAIKAAQQLQGSSKTIADLGEDYENLELNAEFCSKLDELVFCCTTCDNWFEQSEMSDTEDWVCEECSHETSSN